MMKKTTAQRKRPMPASKTKRASGFYSLSAKKGGGRTAAINALEVLEADLQSLLADLEERIPTLEATLAEQEKGKFRGRPLSSLEKAFSISRMLELVCYLRRLRAACRANLLACAARRKELRL
jgi:hypothetical protein